MGSLRGVVGPVLAAAMAVLVGHCNEGCKPPEVPPELVYAGKIADCVNKSRTREESRQCRAKVNWEYGVCPSEDPQIPCL